MFNFEKIAQHFVNKYFFFCALILSVLLFLILKYLPILSDSVATSYALLIILIIFKFTSINIRFVDTSRSFHILVIGINIIGLIYIASSYPSFIHFPQEQHLQHTHYLLASKWIALACGFITFFRPAFIVFPMLFIYQTKLIASNVTRIPITGTDYLPIIEIGMLLGIFSIAYNYLAKRTSSYNNTPVAISKSLNNFDVLVLFCIAIHFGNYFYSGLYKLLLDGGPLEWANANETYHITVNTFVSGHSPISHLPLLFNDLVHVLKDNYIVTNWIVLVLQILSIVALFKTKWAIILIVFYDILHLSIFLTTGIFFWKWILLNIFIVIALSNIKVKTVPTPIFIVCIFIVLSAKYIFFTAKLAWYDTPSLNDVYVEAVTHNENIYRVPSNYFLDFSVTFAQQRVAWPYTGNYPTLTFGTTYSHKTKIKAEKCQLSVVDSPTSLFLNVASQYINNHHKFILNNSDNNGYYNYDMYPHHIWSNPIEFSDFKKLDKRTIKYYKFVIESICNVYTNGKIVSTPNKRSEFIIELNDAL